MQDDKAVLKPEKFWVKAHLALRVLPKGLRTCVFLYESHRPLRAVVNWPPDRLCVCKSFAGCGGSAGTRAQPDLVCGGDSPPLAPRVRASEKLVWDGKAGIWLCVYWGWVTWSLVHKFLPNYQALRPGMLLDPSAIKSLVESIFGLQSSLALS